MARRSFQKGWVSNAMRTSRGVVYKIRYRVPAGDGKWIHKTETLYDLKGKRRPATFSKRGSRGCRSERQMRTS